VVKMGEYSYKIDDFLGGYNNSVEENKLKYNETQNAQNVDISNGNLKTINGYTKYATNAIADGISRLMKFYKNNADGTVTGYLLAGTAAATPIIQLLTGNTWSTLKSGLTSSNFNYINYQQASTDIVIIGNGVDVLMKWDGTTFANLGGTPPVVKSIGLHTERVWGTVDKANPNKVYYSDEFDPEDWTIATTGAGFLDIPTFDGGVCVGLSTIFNDVVIFKTNSIHRIFGTYEGNFELIQVYSTVGSIAERSIVFSSTLAFFLTKDGIYYYDGVSTNPLLGDKIQFTINKSYSKNAVSIIYDNKLYVAFPEGASTVNNSIIVYDLIKKNVMIRRNIEVTDFIEFDDKLLFTNTTGYVYEMDTGTTFDGTAIVVYYETPYTDLDMKNVTKNSSMIYFTASGSGDIKVDYTFDGKVKSKTYTLTATEKVYKKPINCRGRKFKIKFSNVTGSSFTLSSPELIMDLDKD
jgi:hypothetical protein